MLSKIYFKSERCKIALIALLLLSQSSVLFSQAPTAIEAERDRILNKIRKVRQTWELKFRDNLSFDTLIINTTEIINLSKSIENIKILRRIDRFYSNASYAIAASKPADRSLIVSLLNKDLNLKLTDNSGKHLTLESASYLFQTYNVHLTASINGKIMKNGYRLYWTRFLGPGVKTFIETDRYEGNSNLAQNPFNIPVTLPGLVTFWLRNINSHKLYLADSPFYTMNTTDTVLECNFKPGK